MDRSQSARRRRHRVFITLAGASVAASLFPVPTAAAGPASSPATSAVAAPPVPQLRWAGCGKGLQCARARVPLDYDHPRGATISLALARLPARDPGRKLGSIFLNPGGPSGSGVNFVRAFGGLLFSAEVRARFDLVGFDPRGIARSTPLRCFDTAEQEASASPPFPFPVTPAEERVQVASVRKVAEACARRAGPIIDHMATANVARGLALLRQAVGDEQLSFYGGSYGSYLGTTYANLFPGKVRSLAIDGVVDPIAWATGRGNEARRLPLWNRVGSDAGHDTTLREFFRLCRRGGPNCAFSTGDPRRRYHQLAQRLLARPAQFPDRKGGTAALTYAELVELTSHALYRPATWLQFATFLDKLDTAPSSQAAAAALRKLRTRLLVSEDYGINAGQAGVMCSDTANPTAVDAWSRAGARADRAHPYFGRFGPGFPASASRAGEGRRPLHRALYRADRAPLAGYRQPVRPGHAIPGRGDRLPPAPGLAAAHSGGLGSHRPVRRIVVRQRAPEPIPAHHPAPVTWDGVQARRCAVHTAVGCPGPCGPGGSATLSGRAMTSGPTGAAVVA